VFLDNRVDYINVAVAANVVAFGCLPETANST
jgi:hypothetical protein